MAVRTDTRLTFSALPGAAVSDCVRASVAMLEAFHNLLTNPQCGASFQVMKAIVRGKMAPEVSLPVLGSILEDSDPLDGGVHPLGPWDIVRVDFPPAGDDARLALSFSHNDRRWVLFSQLRDSRWDDTLRENLLHLANSLVSGQLQR